MCRHFVAAPSRQCVPNLRCAMAPKSDDSASSGFALGYAVTSCASALKLRCLNIGIGKISCRGRFVGIVIGLESHLENIELITASNLQRGPAIGTDSKPRSF